jgi:hypothetical protein
MGPPPRGGTLFLAATLAADAVVVALALTTTTSNQNDFIDSASSSVSKSSKHHLHAACGLNDVAALTALRAALVVFVACNYRMLTRHHHQHRSSTTTDGVVRFLISYHLANVLSVFHGLCSLAFFVKAIARAVVADG